MIEIPHPSTKASSLVVWEQGDIPTDDVWECAYAQFETESQEIKKFCRRLKKLGANHWPQSSRIVDLFCGRGNGLKALEQMGFTNLAGVDLSISLARQYQGPAQIFVGDCRHMLFTNESKDVLLVQGGLHHLPILPDDLCQVLSEVHRILAPGGLFVLVEPWQTPFLQGVHSLCSSSLVRRHIKKFGALATMIEHEASTYFNWLSQPDLIMQQFNEYFEPARHFVRWGKLYYSGYKKG